MQFIFSCILISSSITCCAGLRRVGNAIPASQILPQPDLEFIKDAWEDNDRTPVWEILRQKLVNAYGIETLSRYHAPVVPATLLYALSAHEKQILDPVRHSKRGLDIHIIGASYNYEGMSDWKLLAETMPSYVHKVNIHLILGTPFQKDGPVRDEYGKELRIDDIEGEQVPMSLAEIRKPPMAAEDLMAADDLRNKVCTQFRHDSTVVNVHCHEKVYQNVWDTVPRPDLVFMSNPGFPLPFRFSYDGVLVHLLNNSIPSLVAAQQTLSSNDVNHAIGAEEARLELIESTMKNEEWADEAYQCKMTLQEFGANMTVAASPFSLNLHRTSPFTLKNNVLIYFAGLKESSGISMLPAMTETPKETDYNPNAEFFVTSLSYLHLGMSQPFDRAVRAWSSQRRPQCVNAHSIADWWKCCNHGERC
jgi:hypothetical protein